MVPLGSGVPREDHVGSFPDGALRLHESVGNARREVERSGVLEQSVVKPGRVQIIFMFVTAVTMPMVC